MAVLILLVNLCRCRACTRDTSCRPLDAIRAFKEEKVDAPAQNERISCCVDPPSDGAFDWDLA